MAVFERWLPLEGPIFHFHDGRKCRWFEFWGFCRICNMSRQRNTLSLLNIFLETINLGFLDPQVTLIRPVKRLVGSIKKAFREAWALRFHLWVKHEHLCKKMYLRTLDAPWVPQESYLNLRFDFGLLEGWIFCVGVLVFEALWRLLFHIKDGSKNTPKLKSDRCSILNGQRRSHISTQIPLASQRNTMGKPVRGWFHLDVEGCRVCVFWGTKLKITQTEWPKRCFVDALGEVLWK